MFTTIAVSIYAVIGLLVLLIKEYGKKPKVLIVK